MLAREASSREEELVAMKVVELKEELGKRAEAHSGNKAWLRRRLHAAIVSEYLESAPRAPTEREESRMSKIFARLRRATIATNSLSHSHYRDSFFVVARMDCSPATLTSPHVMRRGCRTVRVSYLVRL